jgi:hypothetical protein
VPFELERTTHQSRDSLLVRSSLIGITADTQTYLQALRKVICQLREHLELKASPHFLKRVGNLPHGSYRLPSEQRFHRYLETFNQTEIRGMGQLDRK